MSDLLPPDWEERRPPTVYFTLTEKHGTKPTAEDGTPLSGPLSDDEEIELAKRLKRASTPREP